MGSNTIVEEPTNDFDLVAEKKPTFSTLKSQTKKAYNLIESSLTLSNIKIIQSFDRLKIWVDLNEHGKDIGFKLGKNMKLSDIPYLPPPEQYIRINKDIYNDTSDIPVNNTDDEYDDEVVDIKDRKNKYKNCTIDYSIYKKTLGITNIYINKDILVIDITGKLMAAYGDLGLININNIKECLKKLIDLELFTFNIDKFLKYAGCYLADVTMDLFLGKEKRCKRMINAISSFLPNGTFITDIQKAVQFYFLITRSFGGRGDTFGTVKKTSGGACKSLHNVPKKIEAIHERLDTVMIEGRDFEKLINQYDHEGAFFYCDPPYSRGCGYEVTSTKDFDHERLREVLGGIKGRFLLSYDDSPKIRELYKDFDMIAIERLNGINNREGTQRNKMFKELLIANYPIKELYERQTD